MPPTQQGITFHGKFIFLIIGNEGSFFVRCTTALTPSCALSWFTIITVCEALLSRSSKASCSDVIWPYSVPQYNFMWFPLSSPPLSGIQLNYFHLCNKGFSVILFQGTTFWPSQPSCHSNWSNDCVNSNLIINYLNYANSMQCGKNGDIKLGLAENINISRWCCFRLRRRDGSRSFSSSCYQP